MRLVLEYNQTDGYTYSFETTRPFVYESPEAFIVDFEAIVLNRNDEYPDEFEIAGMRLYKSEFYTTSLERIGGTDKRPKEEYVSTYNPPQILTLDEWYKYAEGR